MGNQGKSRQGRDISQASIEKRRSKSQGLRGRQTAKTTDERRRSKSQKTDKKQKKVIRVKKKKISSEEDGDTSSRDEESTIQSMESEHDELHARTGSSSSRELFLRKAVMLPWRTPQMRRAKSIKEKLS